MQYVPFSAESKVSLDGFLSTVQFTETRAYKAVLDTLERRNHVVILGRPGDGKTTLGFQALQSLRETYDINPLIPRFPALGFLSHLADEKRFSIFLDDMFGIYTVSEQAISRPLLYQILSSLRKGNFLIMSMRKDIYLQCKIQLPKELFGQDIVIDLTNSEFELLEKEKRSMMVQSISNINEDTVKKILSHETFHNQQIGFPQCVALMKESNASDFKNILDTPLCYIAEQINLLFENCREKFLALLLVFVSNGRICEIDIASLRQGLPNDVDISCSALSISKAIGNLCGTYFRYDVASAQYLINHESVMEGMAQMLWQNTWFHTYFINNCPDRFLIRLSSSNSATFCLSAQLYTILFERLCRLLESQEESSYMVIAYIALWEDSFATTKFTYYIWQSKTYCIDKNGTSILVHAATQGRVNLVRSLLDNISEDTKQLHLALCKASEHRQLHVVKYILSRELLVVDMEVLFHAIKGSSVEVFQAVSLTAGNLDMTTKQKSMMCMFFSGYNTIHVNLLEEVVLSGNLNLLKHIVETNHLNVFELVSNNPRMAEFAAYSGSVDLMQYIIESRSVKCPHLLWWGACSGSMAMLKYLLDKGCQFGMHKYVSCDDDIQCVENLQDQTEMHGACLKGNIEIIKHLFESNPEYVRMKGTLGCTPALFSPFSGSLDIVKYMEKKGDFTTVSDLGYNILHYAAWHGQLDIIRYLTENYQSLLYVKDNIGRTPLIIAALSGSVECLEYLVSKGCNIFDEDSDGRTILHKACQKGKLALVKHLVGNYPVLLTMRDNEGETPLHTAGLSGSVELVVYLVHQKQCDVFDKDNIGRTILHKACQEGKLTLVKYLVVNYPDLLTMKDNEEETPLHTAGWSNSIELVDYIVHQQQYDVFDKDSYGFTIMHIACYGGKLTLVKHLVERHPALLPIRTNDGLTPLHTAGWFGSVELVEYHVHQQQCDVLDKDNNGRTILHKACQNGKLTLVKYLVVNNPDLLPMRDNEGETPLHTAGWSGSVELVDYLINQQQYDVFDKDSDGWTILHIVCDGGKLTLVKHLVANYQALLAIRTNDG